MYNNNTWESVICSFLIEGSKIVSIRPNKTYYLNGCIPHEDTFIGKFRIRINYYNKIEPTTIDTSFKDYSNTFTITD